MTYQERQHDIGEKTGALELHIFKFKSQVCLLLVGGWESFIKE